MKIHPIVLLRKVSVVLLATLKPLGIWGLGGLAFIDAGLFPFPMDGVVMGYVANEHAKFLLYCLMAAAASAMGSLIPYYVGRAGGELFLLKRINRVRYEAIRDRFERQEFLAIMVPSMMPPPMPLKLFQFAAGVFEMKPLPFALAVFCGKFVQFLAFALITIFYGPEIAHTAHTAIHEHPAVMIAVGVGALLAFAFYVLRKIFDNKRGTELPMEADAEADDPTLIS